MVYLITFLAALMIYSIIMALFSARARRADVVKFRVAALGTELKDKLMLDEEMNQPLLDRLFKPVVNAIAELAGRFASSKKNKSSLSKEQKRSKKDEGLKKTLGKAGITMSVSSFRLLQAFIMVAAGTGLAIVISALGGDLSYALLGAMGTPIVVYIIMRYVIASMGTARTLKLEQQLPDALDILSVSVEAGLGFEQALSHLTKNMTGPMIDEFAVCSREIAMGRTRKDALLALSGRCEFEEMKNFAAAVIQAGQLGISIKNVLRSQSVSLRQSRQVKAQEKAMKVTTKILIPMLLFIFPVLFIILLGPAAMNLIETLG